MGHPQSVWVARGSTGGTLVARVARSERMMGVVFGRVHHCKRSGFAHTARIFFLSAALCLSALSAFKWLTSKLNAEFAEAQRAAKYLFSPYLQVLAVGRKRACPFRVPLALPVFVLRRGHSDSTLAGRRASRA